MDKGELLLNDSVVSSLQREIQEGLTGLSGTPKHLTMLIKRDMWRERLVERTGEVVCFSSFEEFVTTLPLEGLGTDIRTLRNLCRDDTSAINALDQATQNPVGVHVGDVGDVDNINNSKRESPAGTSKTYALRKLRKDRPDLHEKVLKDELSPHKAMVEAGFREKTFTVSSDLSKAARTLGKHFDADELCQAMKAAQQSKELRQ